MNTHLNIIFSPSSVAVIGASANPTKWGNWIAEQVIRHKDIRKIYFVNPKREFVYGQETIESIRQIDQSLDLAIVAVPLHLFENVIDDLLEIGTKAIIGITTGFAERSADGIKLQQRITTKVRKANCVFLGPNCAGVWDSYSPFHCLPIAEFVTGPVGLISQSGGIITDIGIRLQEVGLGFSRIASIGNQSDVCIEDLIANFNADPNTSVIAIYAEHERSIPFHAIRTSIKPIVLMVPDNTPSAKRAAMLHTNSTLYPKRYTKHSTKLNFAYLADNTRELVALVQLALSKQKGTGQRIAIATDTGGMGILAAAAIEGAGFQVNEPSDKLKQQVAQNIGLPQATFVNPFDMINTKSGFSEPTVQMMQILQASPEVDAIVMILFLIENAEMFHDQEHERGLQLAKYVREGGKPVVFVCKTFTSPGTLALLKERMPVYRDIETAVIALETLCG